jgi:hypothetical protein
LDTFPKRHAVSRARFFLELAKQCKVDQRNEFEAYLEASIIFSRAAIHRVKSAYEHHSDWAGWWKSLLSNPAVQFFCKERNWILKNAPPKIGQIIQLGGTSAKYATELYYYENPETPATETVENYLNTISALVLQAESLFTTKSPPRIPPKDVDSELHP